MTMEADKEQAVEKPLGETEGEIEDLVGTASLPRAPRDISDGEQTDTTPSRNEEDEKEKKELKEEEKKEEKGEITGLKDQKEGGEEEEEKEKAEETREKEEENVGEVQADKEGREVKDDRLEGMEEGSGEEGSMGKEEEEETLKVEEKIQKIQDHPTDCKDDTPQTSDTPHSTHLQPCPDLAGKLQNPRLSEHKDGVAGERADPGSDPDEPRDPTFPPNPPEDLLAEHAANIGDEEEEDGKYDRAAQRGEDNPTQIAEVQYAKGLDWVQQWRSQHDTIQEPEPECWDEPEASVSSPSVDIVGSDGVRHLVRLLDELERAVKVESKELIQVWWIVSNEIVNALNWSPQHIVSKNPPVYPELIRFFQMYDDVVNCVITYRYDDAVRILEQFRKHFKPYRRSLYIKFFNEPVLELIKRMFCRHWLLTVEPDKMLMTSSDADVTHSPERKFAQMWEEEVKAKFKTEEKMKPDLGDPAEPTDPDRDLLNDLPAQTAKEEDGKRDAAEQIAEGVDWVQQLWSQLDMMEPEGSTASSSVDKEEQGDEEDWTGTGGSETGQGSVDGGGGKTGVRVYHLVRLLDELEHAAKEKNKELDEVWLVASSEINYAFKLSSQSVLSKEAACVSSTSWPPSVSAQDTDAQVYPELKEFFQRYGDVVDCFITARYEDAVHGLEEFRRQFQFYSLSLYVTFFLQPLSELLRRMFCRHWLLTRESDMRMMSDTSDSDVMQSTGRQGDDRSLAKVMGGLQVGKAEASGQPDHLSIEASAGKQSEKEGSADRMDLNITFRDFQLSYPCNCHLHHFVQQIIDQQEYMCQQQENICQYHLICQWSSLQDQLQQQRDAGTQLLQSYDPASGGLDPGSALHATECLLDLRSQMQEGRYDWCWFRLQTLRTQFDQRSHACIKKFLTYSDLDILQLIFCDMATEPAAGLTG